MGREKKIVSLKKNTISLKIKNLNLKKQALKEVSLKNIFAVCQLVSLFLLYVFSAASEPNLQPPTQICEINCLPQTCGNHREVKLIKLLQKMISKDDIPTLVLGFLSCSQVGTWRGSRSS